MKNKKYYKYLDLIRLLSCIAVFLYHLNLLKGGYLAVCIFFVLTGYLSFVSAFNKEDFSIKKYYVDRLKHIYLPFIVVVFISIFVIGLFPSINWVNLKPETNSVMFGYNNFWQLNASLDYFARHVDSPFMHFWYISILLQFELFFPLLFVLLKNVIKKIGKTIPCVFLIILSIVSTIYFVYSSFTQNIMFVYYNTFTRIFSILFGITLGYINCYYKKLIPIKDIKIQNIVFYSYLFVLVLLFFTIDSNSKVFSICMILVSIISCRLIEYSTINITDKMFKFDNIVKSLSKVSYEIYLVQYPVLFLFQELKFIGIFSYLLILLITLLISYIIHFCLDLKMENDKIKHFVLKAIGISVIVSFSTFGFYKYLITKDHTKELKELESQLSENQNLMEQRQKEYLIKLADEENAWKSTLENLETEGEKLNEYITNLHVIGIGDSVMLGAIKSLYSKFPNGYFDAKTSRTDWEANGILQSLNKKGTLGEPIVFGLGTNGQCGSKCRDKIYSSFGNKKMFWITTTNRKMSFINDELKEFSKSHENVYIIDWEKESSSHNEYFIADRIHLTDIGKNAYSNFIYNEIYRFYLEEFENKKEKMIKEYEENRESKINFYGNNLLLNSFKYLKQEFSDSRFEIDNYTYKSLYLKLKNDLKDNLNNNFVLVFDKTFNITENQYKELIDLFDNKKVYIVFLDDEYNLKYKNVQIIDFKKEVDANNNYLSVDKIHLTYEGNMNLVKRLKKVLN